MKLRTFFKAILVIAVLLGLFWWAWEATTPDSPVVVHSPAKPVVASVSVKMPSQPIIPAPPPEANGAVTSSTEAQPPTLSNPPTPDAVLTMPLDQAEHHVFTIAYGNVGKVEVSITRFHRVLDGNGQRTLEFVNMQVWQSSGVAKITGLGLPLKVFSPEDQAYIRNWAQQQAAAAATTTPDASGPDVQTDDQPVGQPPSQQGPLVITN